MSTPLTMTRLVRWRVRDWASCFLACRFSLDDEQETFPNPSCKLPIRNMATANSTGSVSVQSCNSRDSCRPHLQDEEYIVFCFGEDGGFDVVKECKSPETFLHFTANNTSPRSVNRKLHCVEVSETVRKSSSHQRKSNVVNGHETEMTPVENEEEEADSHSGLDSPCNARTRWCHIGEIDNCGTVSAKSSDSNQSDGSSTESFSFPVMHWELIGSPVQMPKSESLHARKHKAPCARFQCCRF
uniref:Protein BREAKING OF ASYMMETRY IN THE STOMATAL LINEAGE n=1 Tax=Populus alba TaxID=43335 RepID=A0A4U5P2H1_POPAL|nr:hypothetical protein D5086_0000234230 [Populus alba]